MKFSGNPVARIAAEAKNQADQTKLVQGPGGWSYQTPREVLRLTG